MNVLARFDLTGRTAVVTGSTRGLGQAFAVALAEAGADIVIVGRDGEAAKQVQTQVAATGKRSRTVLADLTVHSEVQRVLDEALQEFKQVDILVNNAGACIHRPALEVTEQEWDHVMNVNLRALWMMCQVFGAQMVRQQRGSIINVGSMSGQIVNRPQWQPAYNASKAAVHHLTRSLAAEWAPAGVRVNALAPGYIKTDMSPVDDPRYRQHWIQDAPQQRYGTPEELGPAMVFLASDASSFVTGSVLVADGGYTVF